MSADSSLPFLHLAWRDLVYVVQDSAGSERTVLNGISGYAQSGKMLSCMGSSGAGKTSLLNALAGRLRSGTIMGTIEVNGHPIDHEELGKVSAYVTQEDVLMETQTPREALTFTARLRLPKTKTMAEITKIVDHVLDQLALTHVADNIIGSPERGGLSGGERKRVSIGVELVTNPWLLFVDEPTSGLDSYTALSVMQVLGNLAAEGRCVMCTIHQPSSEIFAEFDDLMLLHQGGVAYFGKASQVIDYYDTHLALPCPSNYNPAEHVINTLMAQLRGQSKGTNFPEKFKEHEFYQASRTPQLPSDLAEPDFPSDSARPGFFSQVKVLAARSWRNYRRLKTGLRARFGQTIFFAVLISLIYANLEDNYAGVQDRQGLMFFMCINQGLGTLLVAITSFPIEKVVIVREHSSGSYKASAYFIAKALAEDPFNIVMPLIFCSILYFAVGLRSGAEYFFTVYAALMLVSLCFQSLGLFIGTIAPSPEIATALAPMFFIPFFLTGGLIANRERLDPYWLWIERISPIAYAYEMTIRSEFEDNSFTSDFDPNENPEITTADLDGNNIIARMNFTLSISTAAWAMVGVAVGFRLIAFLGLVLRLRRERSKVDDRVNEKTSTRSSAWRFGLGSRKSTKKSRHAPVTAAGEPDDVELRHVSAV